MKMAMSKIEYEIALQKELTRIGIPFPKKEKQTFKCLICNLNTEEEKICILECGDFCCLNCLKMYLLIWI